MNLLLTHQETERLRFRLLEKSDFDKWMKLFKGENVATFLGLDAQLSDRELCQIWFDKAFHRYENDLGGMNVLIDKKTNQLIGQCGLLIQNVEDEERLEIGYSILPEYWHQGYASEAAQKCKNYAFENNCSENLISVVHVDNIGSEKVARKNGMQLEKKIEEYKGVCANVFSIDQKDWNKDSRPYR